MNEIKEIKIDLKDKSYKIFINDNIEKILGRTAPGSISK